MSTKIYNGYRMGMVSLLELHQILIKFKQHVRQKQEDGLMGVMAEDVSTWMDLRSLGLQIKGSTPMFHAWDKLVVRLQKVRATKERDPMIDFDCEVCLIPVRGWVYSLIYTEKSDFKRLWARVSGSEPYPYWNNADAPKSVSSRQWATRGHEWGEALGSTGIPADVGMTFAVSGDPPFPQIERIVRFIPSHAKRVERLCYNLSGSRYLKTLDSQPKGTSWVFTFDRWYRSRPPEVVAEEERIARILPKRIRAMDIRNVVKIPLLPGEEDTDEAPDVRVPDGSHEI